MAEKETIEATTEHIVETYHILHAMFVIEECTRRQDAGHKISKEEYLQIRRDALDRVKALMKEAVERIAV